MGKHVMVMDMKGVLNCYESATGKELWRDRVGGNFSSTPISYQGLALFLSDAGETVVVEPGEELKVVSRNSVGATDEEIFRASITPSAGQLFIRSDRMLYCIGERKTATSE